MNLPEIKLEIFAYMNCVDLLNIKLVCIDFCRLINDNDLFNKRKFFRFPRPETYIRHEFNVKIDDLVRGDMIVDATRIFDGHKMVDMNPVDYYGTRIIYQLPKEFTIINNYVPIKYWQDFDINRESWINIVPFRDECLKNIKYRNDEEVETYFTYDKKYVITYFRNYNENKEFIYRKFQQILMKEDTILVEHDDDPEFMLDYYIGYIVE